MSVHFCSFCIFKGQREQASLSWCIITSFSQRRVMRCQTCKSSCCVSALKNALPFSVKSEERSSKVTGLPIVGKDFFFQSLCSLIMLYLRALVLKLFWSVYSTDLWKIKNFGVSKIVLIILNWERMHSIFQKLPLRHLCFKISIWSKKNVPWFSLKF